MRKLAAKNEKKERSLLGPDEEELLGPHDEGIGQWVEGGQEPLFGGEVDDVSAVAVPEGAEKKGEAGVA
jgi:ATP-dependent RNA helicase SUPV3L1/SUV3